MPISNGWHYTNSVVKDPVRRLIAVLPDAYFVPAMLSSLVIPKTQESRAVYNRYGRLVVEKAFLYERSDRKIATVFDNVYQVWRWGRSGSKTGALQIANALGTARAAQRTVAFEAVNRQIERTNNRIMDTLREVTGEKLAADPSAWWSWWDYVNETVVSDKKPTQVAYYEEDTLVASLPTSSTPFHHSCLIAGTPILTDHGPVAVEKVQVGDRVLSQDTVTGELAYKPVLRTTVRPRSPLIHISLDKEMIVASGGHPFWVSGQCWVKARELQPEMLIHTVTGTVPVEQIEIEKDGRQPVYNLVVEDFHNYFAGAAHLLLHDITPREPVLGPVPGWKE